MMLSFATPPTARSLDRIAAALAVALALYAAACGSDTADDEHEDATHAHDLDAEDADFRGCASGIPTSAPGLVAVGRQLGVRVVEATPAELERYANSWIVELTTRDGSPALDARIERGQTFMPVHGHDGRVVPTAAALAQPARFQVDRLNFTMRGPWEVRLWLQAPAVAEDYVVVNVCIAK